MSENFKNIIRELPPVFNTEEGHHIGKEFNSPCIIGSNLYQRQTGALTSNFLKVLTKETIDDLLKTEKNKCRIQFLTHPKLEEVDKRALKHYLENKSQLEPFLEKLMDRSINEFINSSDYEIDKQSRLDIFTTLVAKKTIIIKFGFPKDPYKLFHKKTGIFHFDWGDKIGFIGGQNDTEGGLQNNIEILMTRQSWISEYDLKIINDLEHDFKRSWNNDSKNIETRPLTQANLDRLEKAGDKFNKKSKSFSQVKSDTKFKTQEQTKDNKWSFQDDAVKIFLEKKSGILEMATGSGKTRTAFKIIDKLLNQEKINKIIIQMKGTELIDQWEKELFNWKLNRDENIRILKQNEESKDQDRFLASFKINKIDIIFVSQFFLADLLQKLINENLSKTLIIHDEIHNLPTDNMLSEIKGLHKDIEYKLGLSATVKDSYDADRDNKLYEEIGEIIFRFGTEDAIKRGILVEFDVDFIEYELTESERKEKQKWINWRHKQIQLKQKSQQEIEEIFRREVSKVNKLAINKISLLDNYVKNKLDVLEKCFIFAQEHQYGDKILAKLIKYIPEIKTHYNEHADKQNLEEFASGNLKCIINCKKLNEGINMKNLSNIILVSSESKRQLIQRLGRVLRIDEENQPDKRAFVIDFIENKQLENMDGADYNRYTYLKELSKIKRES